MNKNFLIVVDGNYIGSVAKYAMKNNPLMNKGENTAVLFNCTEVILKLARKFDTNRFAFVWDSRESFREELFPDYKKKRKAEKAAKERSKEDIYWDQVCYEQFDQLRKELIPQFGFKNNFMIRGLEGDDLIAKITKSYPEESIIIISSDKDLYQLLSPRVSIYNTQHSKTFTILALKEAFDGCTPEEWGKALCITGCSTDEVPGISNVGLTTALKYLRGGLSTSSKKYSDIRNGKAIIERNEKLVLLPHENTPEIVLQDGETFHITDFENIAYQYGFMSWLKTENLIKWRSQFKMI
jgi:DNA polymerase I